MRARERCRNSARWFGAAGVSVVLFAAIVHAATRPVPEVVNIKVFVANDHPVDGTLDLLVRVPLAAVKDIQFPLRGEAGYLDLDALRSILPGAAEHWIAGGFDVFDHGEQVPRPEVIQPRISTIDDQSFSSFQSASEHLSAPLVSSTENLFLDTVWFDMRLRYRLSSVDPDVAIEPGVADWGVRVSTDMKIVESGGGLRTLSFEGNPGWIYLAPRWIDAGRQFLDRSVSYVSRAAPLLLFLFCFVLPFRRYRPAFPPLVAFVSTLLIGAVASALGFTSDAVWFVPLLAALEVVAVLLIAFANIAGHVTPRRRTLFGCCAGLVFGWKTGVDLEAALQFGGSHRIVSVLAFSVGMSVTLVALAAIVVPVMSYLFARARTERIERIIVSALAADTAWNWLTERWSQLAKIPLAVVFEAGVAALVLRVLAGLVLFAGALWFLNEWLKSSRLGDAEAVPRPDRKSTA